jgi:DNA-binding Lrp family transcriptional regulator
MPKLDAIDQNIIRMLRVNARISNVQLATEVGLSPSACFRRLRVLEQDGTIRGYTVLLGETVEHQGIAVMVHISLDKQTESHLSRFEGAVRRHSEIRECFLMTGDSDYQLRVEVATARDYERVHNEVLSKLPGVQRIHSSFSIRDVLASSRRL